MEEEIKNDLAGIAITHPFFADMVTNALNYIEKLEKENKTLKNFTSDIFNEDVEKEFIRVNKAKEKIEEYNKREKEELKGMKGQDRYFVKQMYNYMRKPLEELLREE